QYIVLSFTASHHSLTILSSIHSERQQSANFSCSGNKADMKMSNLCLVILFVVLWNKTSTEAAVASRDFVKIHGINELGPYLGIVVPNMFEMNPLLQSATFVPDPATPNLDIMGRRFRIGKVGNKKVMIVMTGLSMINAGITTELLLTLFNLEGVLHYGIAGNANPEFQIGDVTIPEYWVHSGLWVWQKYGSGPNDRLPLESNGDYTREIGFLTLADYNTMNGSDNLLNNVWYQPEEIFPVNHIPEVRQHIFKVPVDGHYLQVAKTVQGVSLERCVNATTCLPREPVTATVEMGASTSVFVDNKAYAEFLHSKLKATAVDMESAAVALVCYQQGIPFIAIRALSDLAGGGSELSNEADAFAPLASKNAVQVLLSFISSL
ncbi:Bark storage protein A, partial [Linum grandiflorum]